LAVRSPGVVTSARVRPGSSAIWLRVDGATSPAEEAVRILSGKASCSWARLDTRASGERRSWGRGVEGDAGVVVVCSPDSVRARRLTGVDSERASLLLGVRRGRVGFMALRPAGVVVGGRWWAQGVMGVSSWVRWVLGRAATHGLDGGAEQGGQGQSAVVRCSRMVRSVDAQGKAVV
jgi:hypothetical protein